MIPGLGKVKIDAMDNEESVDNDKEMVGIPKGVEASEFLEGLGDV